MKEEMIDPGQPNAPGVPGIVSEKFTTGPKRKETKSGIKIPDDPRFPKNLIPENYKKDDWIPYSGGALQYNDDWGWTVYVPKERTFNKDKEAWYQWVDFAFEYKGQNKPNVVGPPAPTDVELADKETKARNAFMERVRKREQEEFDSIIKQREQADKEEIERNKTAMNSVIPQGQSVDPNYPPNQSQFMDADPITPGHQFKNEDEYYSYKMWVEQQKKNKQSTKVQFNPFGTPPNR